MGCMDQAGERYDRCDKCHTWHFDGESCPTGRRLREALVKAKRPYDPPEWHTRKRLLSRS